MGASEHTPGGQRVRAAGCCRGWPRVAGLEAEEGGGRVRPGGQGPAVEGADQQLVPAELRPGPRPVIRRDDGGVGREDRVPGVHA